MFLLVKSSYMSPALVINLPSSKAPKLVRQKKVMATKLFFKQVHIHKYNGPKNGITEQLSTQHSRRGAHRRDLAFLDSSRADFLQGMA